ncbi:hypothetical protein G8A07_20235 [Roseateles sp. DAIF2]|uniref:hypothetical protein n=1 Tax=Roseateles sp. DAIF2 TaxID=2714952 RepID=UPI0018A2B346|nr:hypothetical protein [Roseateles sp. DAIF2]QPF75013.1 hypothetical protein G8A07_20235 [Roseateles sp. DAIF2]
MNASSPTFNARILPLGQIADATDANPAPQAGPRSVGLCFSGGGSRALSCAMGQLRALRYLGLLDQVFASSSVSGGTWANSLFTYLPAGISDDDFLGEVILDPRALSLSVLERQTPNNLGRVPTRLDPLDIIDTLYQLKETYGYANSDLWQGLIGELVLKPYGLWLPGADGFDRRSFSWSEAYLKTAGGPLARNPGLKVSDFITVQRQRPFPILNTSLFSSDATDADLMPFEANFMLGVRANFPANAQQQPGAIGGGLLESFAMGSTYQGDAAPGLVTTSRPARLYSLSDIAGCSSAAFAQLFEEQYPDFKGLVPRYPYWPLQARASQPALNYRFADGGSLENLGVNAMLARGVPRLIVFVNTDEGISRDPARRDVILSDDIPPLFGLQPFAAGVGYVPYGPNQPGEGAARLYRHNQVFETSAFAELQQKLLAAKNAGGALMVRQVLKVLPNSWFDVPAQESVELLWVYNDNVSSWWQQLPFETRAWLDIESVDDFPLYDTVTQLYLTPIMVNALAHLACWNLASPSTLGNEGGLSNGQVVQRMFR